MCYNNIGEIIMDFLRSVGKFFKGSSEFEPPGKNDEILTFGHLKVVETRVSYCKGCEFLESQNTTHLRDVDTKTKNEVCTHCINNTSTKTGFRVVEKLIN